MAIVPDVPKVITLTVSLYTHERAALKRITADMHAHNPDLEWDMWSHESSLRALIRFGLAQEPILLDIISAGWAPKDRAYPDTQACDE